MSRRCDICGKGPQVGMSFKRSGMAKKKGGIGTHISQKTKKVSRPNLQTARIIVDGERKKIKACTGCIKAGKTLSV